MIRRAAAIASIAALLSNGIDYSTNLETNVGMDALFRLRGPRPAPLDVVVVAMDEASEAELGVGQDLTRWRRLHGGLVRQLHRQNAALIVFDLQFIVAHNDGDRAFADAIAEAGNVLLVDCVQKFRRGVEDYFGREECSETNKVPFAKKDGPAHAELSERLVAMRKLSATPLLLDAALDHAPFFLNNDAENATVRETWTFYDALAEQPSLPLVAWLYRLRQTQAWQPGKQIDTPLSVWLTEQRRQCAESNAAAHEDRLERQIDAVVCHGDSRHLDYYGPPHTLRMESYSDVYHGRITDLTNKVVFVGKANRLFAAGKTDFFQTPFTDSQSGKMAGVEIMATQFANLIENRFVTAPLPHWVPAFAFGLLIGLTLTYWSGIYGLLASIAIGGAYAGLVFFGFSRYGIWLPLAGPLLLQLPLSWLLALAWSRRDLLHERTRILGFVRQVFPQWLHLLPSSPGHWDPERNAEQLTSERYVRALCLATDIEGYTALTTRHSAREMWHLLKSYYRVLGHPVASHHGEIANIQGDEMMAMWIDAQTAAQRLEGCLAALDIKQAVEAFNRASTSGSLPTRIGLHEGELVLGSGESAGFRFYNPFGDTVNTASRIQGVNKFLGTRILASRAVVEGLSEIACRPVGAFRVEGRQDPLELVEIIAKTPADGEAAPRHHRQFAYGLSLFRQGNWTSAAKCFQTILTEYGDDGPSEYYRKLALIYQDNPPPRWDGIVTLSEK